MTNPNPSRWKPGQSGNPKGRPPIVHHVLELARQHSGEAIMALVEILRDKNSPPAARAMAANSILDRGYGKPAQSVDIGISRKSLDELSDVELAAIAAGADDEKHAEELNGSPVFQNANRN